MVFVEKLSNSEDDCTKFQKSAARLQSGKWLSQPTTNFVSEIFKGGGIQLRVHLRVLYVLVPEVRLDCPC